MDTRLEVIEPNSNSTLMVGRRLVFTKVMHKKQNGLNIPLALWKKQ